MSDHYRGSYYLEDMCNPSLVNKRTKEIFFDRKPYHTLSGKSLLRPTNTETNRKGGKDNE